MKEEGKNGRKKHKATCSIPKGKVCVKPTEDALTVYIYAYVCIKLADEIGKTR